MRYEFYKPVYFRPEELVPPRFAINWYKYCDGTMLIALDRLRDRFGSITINNYLWGGNLQYAGYRPFDSGTGSNDSQHCFGRAFDLKFGSQVDLEEVISHIQSSMPEITIVRKYNWGLHIDNRNCIKQVTWRSK